MKQKSTKKIIRTNNIDSESPILNYVDILVSKINVKLDSIIEMVGGMAEDLSSIKSWIKEHEQVTHRSVEFRLNSLESTTSTSVEASQ